MKLHAWDILINDKRLRALTRDRPGRALRRPINIASQDAVVFQKDWSYAGIVSTTAAPVEHSNHIRALHDAIRKNGYVVVTMPDLHRRFFVFDISLDAADLRVYSADKELTSFNDFLKHMQLGTNGDMWLGGGEATLVGDVEIASQDVAKRMGIDDFERLQSTGLWVSTVNTSQPEERIRRYMERELPDKLREFANNVGIDLISLRVDSVTISRPERSPSDGTVTMKDDSMGHASRNFVVSNPDAVSARAKVLIVTALEKEGAAMLALLDEPRQTGKEGDPNIYNVGTLKVGEDQQKARAVVLATQSDIGKANAAAVGADAIRSFPNLRHIIMVGIAGGCPNPNNPEEHVRLGDIVVSDARGVIEYDDIKQTKEGREYRGPLRAPSYELLQAITQLGTAAIAGVFPWEKHMERGLRKLPSYERPDGAKDILHEGDVRIEHPFDPERQRRPGWPRVHRGAIATADTLLKTSALRDELRDRFGVRAIEMEGSGLQTAAWAHGKDIMVVRGICDYCDEHKDNAWQKYAALAAAAYARALIEVLPDAWFG